MDNEVDPEKLRQMRIQIMELERYNTLTSQFSSSQMQKKIYEIIVKVVSGDN